MSLSMGTSRSRFLRAFFIESSVFQRNNHILRILFYFCAETLLASRTNHNATTETRKKRAAYFFVPFFLLSFKYILLIFQRFFAYNVQHTFWKISLPSSHDQHCQP